MKIIYLIATIFSLCGLALGIYEDQVGKFEWRQQYIGKANLFHFDIISPLKKIIVATNKNVLAALSLKSGEIIWRQVLETNREGEIKLLHVDSEIVTVSGTLNPLIRGWELENGHALFEWGLSTTAVGGRWLVVEDNLVLLQLKHSEVSAQWFNLRTGAVLGSKKGEVSGVIDPNHCVTQEQSVTCLTERPLSLNVISPGSVGELNVTFKDVAELFGDAKEGEINAVEGKLPLVTVKTTEKQIVFYTAPEITASSLLIPSDALIFSAPTDEQHLVVSARIVGKKLEVRTQTMDGTEVSALQSSVPYPSQTANPESGSAVCQERRDKSVACRVLLSAADYTLALIQHPGGEFLWVREEALAAVLAVEIVDLPVSDTDAAIEKEFGSKEYGSFGMLTRRLLSQWLQVQTLLLTVLGVSSSSTLPPSGLVRDDFGLHKLIVAVTESGKVFGIDNLSGEITWRVLVDLKPTYAVFPMRSSSHIPYNAQLAVLGRGSDGNAALLVINPITGALIEPLHQLPYTVLQATALQTTGEDFLKGILLLDKTGQVHVYPSSAESGARANADKTFLYTVNSVNGQVNGYRLKATNGKLVAVRTWQQTLGQDDAHVVAVVGKRPTERVHSQGRVLGDRSVLYKYVNPNLVAIFTQGYHPSHKTVLNVYLVDVVSGLIVSSASHRRARDPVQAVHSENWLVYSYVSEKHRRTEIATLEFYEGTVQANATAFSSLATPPLIPIVERQAYILPAHVTTLMDTVTEKGITTKHIIVAMSNGAVLELPWAYLDARRTMMVTPEMREEGVVPYIPELPIPLEAVVNHNQTVANIRGVHTAPSGIESTCLLFVYGLDILYTRVAPSKTFDLLKEDFDYFLITAVLSALLVASFITRRMASRKALKQAWK